MVLTSKGNKSKQTLQLLIAIYKNSIKNNYNNKAKLQQTYKNINKKSKTA